MLPLTICGNDPTLLATRKLLLELHGFQVQTVLGVAALEGVEVLSLILCYTLGSQEQKRAVQLCKAQHPGVPILVLGGDVREHSFKGCATLTAYPSSSRLLDSARQLVTYQLVH